MAAIFVGFLSWLLDSPSVRCGSDLGQRILPYQDLELFLDFTNQLWRGSNRESRPAGAPVQAPYLVGKDHPGNGTEPGMQHLERVVLDRGRDCAND